MRPFSASRSRPRTPCLDDQTRRSARSCGSPRETREHPVFDVCLKFALSLHATRVSLSVSRVCDDVLAVRACEGGWRSVQAHVCGGIGFAPSRSAFCCGSLLRSLFTLFGKPVSSMLGARRIEYDKFAFFIFLTKIIIYK